MRREDLIPEILAYLQKRIATSTDLLEHFSWHFEKKQEAYETLRDLRQRNEISFIQFGKPYGYKRYLYFISLNAQEIVSHIQDEIIKYLEEHLVEYSTVLQKHIFELFPQVTRRATRVIIRDMAYRGVLKVFPFINYKNYESVGYYLPKQSLQIKKMTQEISSYIQKEKCIFSTEISTEKKLPPKLCVICLRHLVWLGELNCKAIGRHPETQRLIYLYFLPGLSPDLERLLLNKKKEKRLLNVRRKIISLNEELDGPAELIDETSKIFNSVLKSSSIMKGRSEDLIILACFYLASNKLRTGITAYEIAQCWAKAFNHFPSLVSSTQDLSNKILQNAKLCCKYLDLDISYLIRKPVIFVPRILEKVGIRDKKFLNEVKNFLEMMPSHLITGASPAAVAATAIYIVGKKRFGKGYLTEEEVSSAAFVTTVTIRNILRKWKKYMDIR